MKKIIAVILIIAMSLCFASCGAETMLGQYIAVTVKGNGSKTVKISAKDSFADEYTLEYFLSEGDDAIYKVAETKSEKNLHKYSITGNNAGSCGFKISYLSESGSVIGIISMSVTVSEDKKVTVSEMSLVDADEYKTLDEERNIVISANEDDGSRIIQLSNEQGRWDLGEYNDSLIRVTGPELVDGTKTSQFVVSAIEEGESYAYIINRSTRMQLYLLFNATSELIVPTETNGLTESVRLFHLELVRYEVTNYVKETSEETKKVIDEIKKEYGEDIMTFPEEAVYRDAVFFDKTEAVEYEYGTDMTIEYKGFLIDYQTSINKTADEYIQGIMDVDYAADTVETLSGGGIQAQYMYISTGFGAAVWTKGSLASRLTIMSGQNNKSCKELIQLLLDAQAL